MPDISKIVFPVGETTKFYADIFVSGVVYLYMPKINVLPSVVALPHDQHFYQVTDSRNNPRGPFGPFSLDELRQQFSTMGLAPSDIQNFLDQIGSAGNSLELEIPIR